MRVVVTSLAVATVLAAGITGAEARARFKFRSSPSVSSSTPKPAVAATPASPVSGVAVPAALVGGSMVARSARARSSGDLSTGSTELVTLPLPTRASGMSTAAAPTTATKPVFVCASDRTVGRGVGFCDLH